MKKVYLAGHCLTRGSQMQRAAEKEELLEVNDKLKFYVPQENKEINDKENLDNNDGLAEKIVRHDTNAINWSDTVVIEPLPEACGTMVELGQIKGMRDVAKQILQMIDMSPMYSDPLVVLDGIRSLCRSHSERKVYPHYEDIRRFDGVTESGDRRSLGINQFVYGVCLDLTDGKGFYSWPEILEEISDRPQ